MIVLLTSFVGRSLVVCYIGFGLAGSISFNVRWVVSHDWGIGLGRVMENVHMDNSVLDYIQQENVQQFYHNTANVQADY